MVKYSTSWYKNKYQERLDKAHEYLGGKCVDCGSKKHLHIHHKNPKEKSFTVTEKIHGMAWDKIIEELKKCTLFCKKCYRKFHLAKCGTAGGYGRGCRCGKCTNANRDYMRKYRMKKRGVAQLVQ